MQHFGGIVEFVAAVERGSFTAAATRLGLTTSGVSKAVARLEERLGVRLLNRTTRRLGPTAEGAAFYPRAKRLLLDLAEMEGEVAQGREHPAGMLRIDLPPVLGRYRILPALPGFLARWPDLRLQVTLRDRVTGLAEEGVDAAVRIGDVQAPTLIARRLGMTRFITCASPAYLRRHPSPARPEELLQHNCLRYVPSATSRPRDWRFADGSEPVTVAVSGPLTLNSTEGLVDAALAELGIIQVLDFVVADHVRDGRLQPVLEAFGTPARPISFVYLEGRHRSANLRAFGNFLMGIFAQTDELGVSPVTCCAASI